VPIDRAAALRQAEKLLRQGKLDLAVAEYLRIVEDQPRDWNTANLLGDLYMRVGQTDEAVERFVGVADSLSEEGFLPKAAAMYKKVLKARPDHEHALLQSAELAASQGLLLDARRALNAVAEQRRRRGDDRGAARIVVRLASLDPADYDARLAGARARLALDPQAALHDLKALADELVEKGRLDDAIRTLREAAAINPEDSDIRARLFDMHLAAGDFASARECASTAAQLKGMGARLDALAQHDDALETLRDAARLDSSDTELRAHLARAFAARGQLDAAAEFLTAETTTGDAQLLLTDAEARLRAGRTEEALALVRRLLDQQPNRRQDVALLGWTIARQAPDAGHQLVTLAADAAVAHGDWASAAAALQEFVTRVPHDVEALLRLVEICVDGGLEATMYTAQAQLADAYLAAGAASEARFIAEDLVAREPWDRANIERFRRALVLLGEADPDGVIAQRLDGETPFTSSDASLSALSPLHLPDGLSAAGVSVPAEPEPDLHGGDVDLDLNVDLDAGASLPGGTLRAEDGARDVPSEEDPAMDLEPADGGMPEGGSRREVDAAERDFELALALEAAGRIDECMAALQVVARVPALRFAAASRLGRLCREREMTAEAIEWLEEAAQLPAPDAADGHQILYELADALESAGETARALAVGLELQADAGEYRDIVERVERLARAQTRG
jgi:tetratricopeptide (TPR) repeat protein